jgi:DNA-binding SARP family transcriptional activator
VPWRRLARIMTSPCAYAAETSFGRLPPNLNGPLATYHSRWSAHVAQVSGRPVDWGNSLTDVDEAGIRVQLLGPVRAWRGDDELELGGPQRRALLGMLASRRQVVSRGELIDGLWGHRAPASAGNSVHVHISALRRVLEPRRASRAPGTLLTATGPGYRLNLAPGTLDTDVLEGHRADARLAAGTPRAALRSLDAALSLWQGATLAGVPGPWADIERTRLEELRHATTADRIDILLRLGGHHEVLAELTALTRRHPLRERFWGQLMLALYRCGRQGEALAAFADARRELAEQLGVDPGLSLRRLHEQVLAADPALEEARPAQPERAPGCPRYPPPDAVTPLRQLTGPGRYALQDLLRAYTAHVARAEAAGGPRAAPHEPGREAARPAHPPGRPRPFRSLSVTSGPANGLTGPAISRN